MWVAGLNHNPNMLISNLTKTIGSMEYSDDRISDIVIGTLNPNFLAMERQFTSSGHFSGPYECPQKISSGTLIRIPRVGAKPRRGSTHGTAICMLTLDWDENIFNSNHTVPFPLKLEWRKSGSILDPWIFNATSPRGISMDGKRYGCPGDTIAPEGHIVHHEKCVRYGESGEISNNESNNYQDNTTKDTNNIPWESPDSGDSTRTHDPTSKSNVIIATVGSVAAVMMLALIACGLWCNSRRKRRGAGVIRRGRLEAERDSPGDDDTAVSGYTGQENDEAASIEIVLPPPTYAEAMKN